MPKPVNAAAPVNRQALSSTFRRKVRLLAEQQGLVRFCPTGRDVAHYERTHRQSLSLTDG